MRTSFIRTKNTIKFTLFPDDATECIAIGQRDNEIRLIEDEFSFDFPIELKTPHPDIIALTVLCAIQPFVLRKISFPIAVSQEFARAVTSAFGIEVTNIDKKLRAREAGAKYALAFSGGADSIAATILMPEDTIKFTYLRKDHPKVKPRIDNFRETTIEAVSAFEDVILVDSDLEYICSPYLQWSTWVAVSCPGLLLADTLNLKGIAYGHIFGGEILVYSGEEKRFFESTWLAVFKSAGLDIILPTCGLTELGTMAVVRDNSMLEKSTSCQLGKYQKPCRNCQKCFRKDLVLTAINEMQWSHFLKLYKHYEKSPKVINNVLISKMPLVMQYVYIYSMKNRRNTNFTTLKLFRKKVLLSRKAVQTISWAYRHNQTEVRKNIQDEKLYERIIQKTGGSLRQATAKDLRNLNQWNLEAFYSQPHVKATVSTIDAKIKEICS